MKGILILIVFFNFGFYSNCQTNQNYDFLNQRLTYYVNNLRDSLGLNALKPDSILNVAATNHSQYMAKFNILDHNQKFSKTKTPTKRVKKYGGNDFELIGENVLFENVSKIPNRSNKIDELAKQMFTSWKNSSGHYANMTNPNYVFGGFGFAFNKNSGKIYATQVFGVKGYVIPNQLSENTFGLQYSESNCDSLFSNMLLNMGNSIVVKNNIVYLEHHSLNQVKGILTNSTDGVAIDLVSRNQFECNKPNLLDISQIYDGILLKPIYFDELMANNTSQSDYRLITPIGIIPPEVDSENKLPSLVIIKNGKACAYIIPAYHPNGKYNLIEIEPELVNPSGIIYAEKGITQSKVIEFEFETSRNRPIEIKGQIDNDNKNEISGVSIFSYSSIEGDSTNNSALHLKRAHFIKNYLNKNGVKLKDSLIQIYAKENWSQCYFQLELLGLDNMMILPKDSIRQFVVTDSLNNWTSLLYQQRKSIGIIHYQSPFDSSMTQIEFLAMNLRTAILNNQIDIANKAMADIYNQDFVSLVMFEEEVMNHLKSNPDLVQNASALYSKYYMFDLYKVTEFVASWLGKPNELSDNAKANILQLYNLTTKEILKNWDTSSQQLAKVLHPSKIEKLTDQVNNDELLLNFHLAAIEYYGQINDSQGINESFDFIKNHFENSVLNINDVNQLCLFFNSWSMGKLTIDFLYARINNPDFNVQSAFILATTLSGFPDKLTQAKRNKVYQKAYELSPQKWCEWVNTEFQILRNLQAKTIYCKHCNELKN